MARIKPLHYQASSGIVSVLLQPDEQLVSQKQKEGRELGEKWTAPEDGQPGKSSYNPSVMILDTFFSDDSDKTIIKDICNNPTAFPSIKILLVNPESDFALRQPSVNNNSPDVKISKQERAKDKFIQGIRYIADALTEQGTEINISQYTIDQLIQYIKDTGGNRNLEIKFYDEYSPTPMYFFNDILVCGRFGVASDCLKLPWYTIVDDPICNRDLFDENRKEFEAIWEKAQDSIKSISLNIPG